MNQTESKSSGLLTIKRGCVYIYTRGDDGKKLKTYRQKIKDAVREFLALTDVPLPCPNVPLGNLPRHGRFIRKVDFAQEVEDAPKRLDLRHHGRLNGVDLTEDDERSVVLERQIQRDGALVEPPAALGRGAVGLWVLELGALGQKRQSFVDDLSRDGVVLGPRHVCF